MCFDSFEALLLGVNPWYPSSSADTAWLAVEVKNKGW